MRAAVFTETGGPLSIEDLEPAPPGPRDVIVQLGASGVCHSDLSLKNGYVGIMPGTVLGHEGAGTIVEVGKEVVGLAKGDRIVASFIPACGVCCFCLHDQSHLCDTEFEVMMVMRGKRPDGSEYTAMTGLGTFAEAMTCDQSSIVKINTSIPDEQLALIGCGVTTGVGAALNTAQVHPGATVAVIGCGGVGQAVIQGARIAGASRIIAVDPVEMKRKTAGHARCDRLRRPRRRRRGRAGAGAHRVAAASTTRSRSSVSPRPRSRRYNMIRKGGTAVMVGMTRAEATVTLSTFDLFFNEKTIKGCKYGSGQVRRDFQRFADLIETGSSRHGVDGVAHDQARRGKRGFPRNGSGRSHSVSHHRLLTSLPTVSVEGHDAVVPTHLVAPRSHLFFGNSPCGLANTRSNGRHIAYVMAATGEVVTYARAERSVEPARAAVLGRGAAVRRSHRGAHGEPRRVLRAVLGRAAFRAVLHVHQLALQRGGSRVHPRRLRRAGARRLRHAPRCRGPARSTRCRSVKMRLMVGDARSTVTTTTPNARDRYPAEPLDEELEGTRMLYSSGTTGRPKGMKYKITAPARRRPARRDGDDDGGLGHGRRRVYLSPAPLYHSAPLFYSMSTMRLGGTVITMEHFDPEQTLACIEKYRVTARAVRPHDVRAHAEAARRGPQQVRPLVAEGRAARRRAVLGRDQAQDDRLVGSDHQRVLRRDRRHGRDLHHSRRLARAPGLGRAFDARPDPHRRRRRRRAARRRGRHVWFEPPPDRPGFEYHKDEEKTRDSFNDTRLVDRRRHGLPRRRRLPLPHRSPDVHDRVGRREHLSAGSREPAHRPPEGVRRRGVRHPRRRDGRAVQAVVQPTDWDDAGPELEAELLAYCREHLAHYKCPQAVDFDPELPREQTGKLYKRLLRDRYWGDKTSRIV